MPLSYNNRLYGVLNLSNKRDGEPFDELDLERAMMAGSLVAMALGVGDAHGESVDDVAVRIRAASSAEIIARVQKAVNE